MFKQTQANNAIADIKVIITKIDPARRHPEMILEDDPRIAQINNILEKHPELLSNGLIWEDSYGDVYSGNILHMAAFFNHPALVNYLVKEKGMDPDSRSHNGWTALHHASRAHALWAVLELVRDLKANPELKTATDETAYDVCQTTENHNPRYVTSDRAIALFIDTYHRREYWSAEQLQKEKQQAEEQRATAAKSEGVWTVISPASLEHVHETQEEQPKRLRDVFNLSRREWVRTITNLKTSEVKKEKRSLTRAQLEELKDQLFILRSNKPTVIKTFIAAPAQ